MSRALTNRRDLTCRGGGENETGAKRARPSDTRSDRDRSRRSDGWIEGALAYVPHVARRFLGCGIPFDELLAAGNLGLVEAALRFDPARNVKFVTYADWWIRKGILRAIQQQSGPVHLPRYRLEQLRDLGEARQRLREENGSEPDAEDLARATGRTPSEVYLLLGIRRQEVSLDESASPHTNLPLDRTLADDPEKGPQNTLIRKDYRRQLRRLVARLATRERRVITLRYGLRDGRSMTLRQIGGELGISRERVRQIERRALGHLRDLL